MEHVTTLLKRRKEAAKVELTYCEEGNYHYDSARKKLINEIEQIDKALLILSNDIIPLPSFLYQHEGGLYFRHLEDTDVTDHWNEYIQNKNKTLEL
jgi:hypothetical protein